MVSPPGLLRTKSTATKRTQTTKTKKVKNSQTPQKVSPASGLKAKSSSVQKKAPVKEMNKHVSRFVESILDPDRIQVGYPGNTYGTLTAPQKIAISAANYSADGDVSLYISDNPLVPARFSVRAPLAFEVGFGPFLTIIQPVESSLPSFIDIIYPLEVGTDFTLFSAPVTFSDHETLPGYHASVNTNAMIINVAHNRGVDGLIITWHRTSAGAYSESAVNVVTNADNTNVTVPVGATAFGFKLQCYSEYIGTFIFSQAGAGGHALTIGNHSSFTRKYAIPDYKAMNIDRARLIGCKSWIKYLGGDLENAGRIAAAQFPPGTFPVMFEGNSTYEQILSANIRGTHDGAFKHGCVSRYIAPNPFNYELNSRATRFGDNGFIVHNWTSDPAHPQPYRIAINIALEYTSRITFVKREPPPWASPVQLSGAIEILNKMQVITENPNHELVTRLWDKLKRTAVKVATSEKLWYSIAEVGLGALAVV